MVEAKWHELPWETQTRYARAALSMRQFFIDKAEEDANEVLPTPSIGSAFRHKDGGYYCVYDITNVLSGKPNFPRRMVYINTMGETFSRDLRLWNERYDSIAEELNYPETMILRDAALQVQGAKDLLQRRFSEVITSMESRRQG